MTLRSVLAALDIIVTTSTPNPILAMGPQMSGMLGVSSPKYPCSDGGQFFVLKFAVRRL